MVTVKSWILIYTSLAKKDPVTVSQVAIKAHVALKFGSTRARGSKVSTTIEVRTSRSSWSPRDTSLKQKNRYVALPARSETFFGV